VVTIGEAELRATLAARLIQARVRRGLSQKELAARLGSDPSVLSRCERGVVLPTLLTLLRLAEALGVTTDFLLTGRHSIKARSAGAAIWKRLEKLERLPPEQMSILLPFLDCLVATLARAGVPPGAAAPSDPGRPS
jgi:transcriptional regulator with XRE-family HTH domain